MEKPKEKQVGNRAAPYTAGSSHFNFFFQRPREALCALGDQILLTVAQAEHSIGRYG